MSEPLDTLGANGPSVTVVDLRLGNLGSVLQALRRAGGSPTLSSSAREIAAASRVLVPGVAAFGLGMERALALDLAPALRDALARGASILGICLGMQLLFDEGEEDGARAGLGLLRGRVTRLPTGVPAPHIGWQRLSVRRDSPLAREGAWSYFAHSYRCEAQPEETIATVEHGGARIAAVVESGGVHGAQFHPEKSAHHGLALLRRFLALPARKAA